ncbi:MAG: LysM peptidoglycan-binding domain-containing protein [Candidatus Wallacebacter cryptica]|nr:LysM peptidoglycan-binding domain-containing protein [Bacillota bacterium]
MSKVDNSKSAYSNKFIYMAIRAALILAILSIIINTYVLWNVYLNREDAEDPTAVSVAQLGSELGSKISGIEQRLISMEINISELPKQEVDLSEVLAALDQMDDLDSQIAEIAAAVNEQQEGSAALTAVVVELKNLLEEMHQTLITKIAAMEAEFIARLDELTAPLEEQSERSEVAVTVQRGDSIWALASRFENPPSQELIDRIIEYNKITDPTKLRIGQVIVIPES